jgi:polysaccharide chain length determinant protein (PEP-CTERM system associated)
MIRRELTPADYLAILRRRWVPIVVLTLLGGPLAYGISRLLPSRYTSQTTVLVQPPTVPKDVVHPVVTEDISQQLASMKAQILSRTRLEPIIRQYGLYASDANKVPMEDLVARLQDAIKVVAVRPMEETSGSLPGFNVEVTLDDPRTAQAVCSSITSMFIEENAQLRQQHSEETTDFLTQQLADAKQKLDAQDRKLAAFQSQHLGSLPDDDKTNLNILTGLTSQLDAATQALSRAQQDKSFLEASLNQAVDAWQASQNGHNPETLEEQLAALQTKLTDLESRYTDSYPDVIRTKADIAALKQKIAEQGQNADASTATNTNHPSMEPPNIQQLRAELHNAQAVITEKASDQEELRRQIKLYESRVQATPAVEEEYKELTRGYQAALDTYNQLEKNREEAQMATNLERRQEGETFSILDPANFPDKPSFPNRPLFTVGGFAGGLALGMGLAFLLDMQDTSIRTEQDVEYVLHLPVIATVPAIRPLEKVSPRRLGDFQPVAKLGTRAGG